MVAVDADEPETSAVQPADGSRRAFLTGAGAAAVAGLAAACSGSELAETSEVAPTAVSATAEATSAPVAAAAQADQAVHETVPFFGLHQAGVLHPAHESGIVASFDVVTTDPGELAAIMQSLSVEIERIMSDQLIGPSDGFRPPADSGAVDADTGTAGVTVTVAVGASLFDDRFGLSDMRPRELIAMPRFFNDRLIQDELSHGDLSLTITAPDQQGAVFALHQMVRVTDRRLRLRWVQEGYNQILPERPGQIAKARNLLGFRDGTSNLDTTNAEQMQNFVWVQPGDSEPEWAVGGTYQAARIIRMLIEFWATAALVRQEQIFGRERETGAPLGQSGEGDEPSFVSNPADDTIPRRSHIRLANPGTPNAARILRQGYSYLNGVAVDGTMDQGLLFTCYQRSLSRGFFEVQTRLDGEPLEDYIKPVGGGLFFVLPGPSQGEWLGQSLFEA